MKRLFGTMAASTSVPPWKMTTQDKNKALANVTTAITQLYSFSKANKSALGMCLCATGGASFITNWLLSIPGASSTVLDIQFPYNQLALMDYIGQPPTDGFCSKGTSMQLARSARDKALEMQVREHGIDTFGQRTAVGIGYTGVLSTNREHKGEHRGYVGLADSSGRECIQWVVFGKGIRGREEEDFLTSYLLIKTLVDYINNTHGSILTPLPWFFHQKGDSLGEEKLVETPELAFNAAIQALASGDKEYGTFWPKDSSQEYISGLPVARIREKERAVLLCGSFNPFHEGHEMLGIAALKRLREQEKGVKHVLFFEIGVSNADKGTIDHESIATRVRQFMKKSESGAGKYGPWPVVVTTKPRFVDKAILVPGCVFVVGADTAIRIVNPKYYNDSNDNVIAAFLEMKKLGCSFVVAAKRYNKLTKTYERFDVRSVATEIQSMFTVLSEDEFRVDLSSTEIRNAAKNQSSNM